MISGSAGSVITVSCEELCETCDVDAADDDDVDDEDDDDVDNDEGRNMIFLCFIVFFVRIWMRFFAFLQMSLLVCFI